MRTLTFLLATGLVYAQSGDWLLTTTEFGATQYQRIDFKVDGEKIPGRAGNLTYEGTLRDGRVAFESKRADGSTITKYSGTYVPGEMQGEGTRSDSTVTFTARRFKDKPATPPNHPLPPTRVHSHLLFFTPPPRSV